MIEFKRFFKCKTKNARRSVIFCKTSFRKYPTTFDAIYVIFSPNKYILPVIHAIRTLPAQNQPIICALSVSTNCRTLISFLELLAPEPLLSNSARTLQTLFHSVLAGPKHECYRKLAPFLTNSAHTEMDFI